MKIILFRGAGQIVQRWITKGHGVKPPEASAAEKDACLGIIAESLATLPITYYRGNSMTQETQAPPIVTLQDLQRERDALEEQIEKMLITFSRRAQVPIENVEFKSFFTTRLGDLKQVTEVCSVRIKLGI